MSAIRADALDVFAERLDPTPDPYVADPVAWVEGRLGERLWSVQRRILEALRDHRKVAVHSCHGIGKDFTAARAATWWVDTHPADRTRVVSCYTDDTEVLTRAGWKLFRDVQVGPDGDEFATRNPDTKAFEWQRAFRYVEAPWDGEVVDFTSSSMHIRVTPNHRMLVHWEDKRRSGEILKAAEDIGTRWIRIPQTSKWAGSTPAAVRFGRYEWAARDFAAFLGAWLADGSLGSERSGSIVITRPRGTKGFEAFRAVLARMLGREPSFTSGKNFVFPCRELWEWLKPYTGAATKRIPAEVKDWGGDELDVLLHHYLLGDGYYSKPSGAGVGRWTATTVSARLADDLQEVAQKLGGSATVRPHAPRDACINGRRIPAENCLPFFTLCFNTSQTRRATASRSHYRGNVYCVSVPNEVLYVRRQGTAIWCGNTAPTNDQVVGVLWQEIDTAHKAGGLAGRLNTKDWWIGSRQVGLGRKPSDYSSQQFQGFHALFLLVILDEAGGIPSTLWEDAEKLTTADDVPGVVSQRILAIGNPDYDGSHFSKVCSGKIPGWHVIHVGYADTPNFTDERDELPIEVTAGLIGRTFVDGIAATHGTDSPKYTSQVLGLFPKDRTDGVVPFSWAMQCVGPDAAARIGPLREPVELGVDVAGSDDGDWTVIAGRAGMRALAAPRTPPMEGAPSGLSRWRLRTTDPDVIVTRVLDAVLETQATSVKVDADGGYGFAIVEPLRKKLREDRRVQWPVEVIPVHVGEASTLLNEKGKPLYRNRKAEIWWTVGREYSRLRQWDLSELDEDVIDQLCEPLWFETPDTHLVQIESKKDLKKRVGHSTDAADALLLAFYEPPVAPPVAAGRYRDDRLAGSR